MQPILLSTDELTARYRLTSRIATRINALLAKGLGISPVIAELLATDEPLKNLLLARDLLDMAQNLDAAMLAELQQKFDANGYFAGTPLALSKTADGSGHSLTVLCLDEELLAESVASAEVPAPAAAPNPAPPPVIESPPPAAANPAMLASVSRALAPANIAESVQELFTAPEIAKLRLTLLTSTDPAEKIRAIRTLRLLPLDANEKGALLLRALQDESAAVRGEAASSLTTLGLSERIADAVVGLSTGNEIERETSIRTLQLLTDKAREAELGVVFAVLVGTLNEGGSKSLTRYVLAALKAIAPRLAVHDGPARELDRQLARLITTRYDEVSRDVYAVYHACANSRPLRDLVRHNFAEAPTDSARTFYVSLLAELDPSEDSLHACIEEMAARAITNELDPSTARLAAALRGFGDTGATALLQQLDSASEDKKEVVLAILNTVFFGTPLGETIVDAVVEKLADIYPLSRPQVRLAILGTPFLMHPKVSIAARRRIGKAVIDDIHEHRLERTHDELQSVLRKLGPAVLPDLRLVVETHKFTITRLQAAAVVGKIATDFHALHFPGESGDVQSHLSEESMRLLQGLPPTPDFAPEDWRIAAEAGIRMGAPMLRTDAPPVDDSIAAEFRQTFASFRALVDNDHFPDKGPLYVALGKLAFSGCIEPPALSELTEMFTERVGSTSYAYALVEAMGYLVAARDLPLPDRAEIAQMLLRVVKSRLPDRLSSVKETPDGKVYVLEHETTAYTDLLPRVLQGLNRLALTRAADETLRTAAVGALLEAWNDVVDFRVVWGPQNSIDLAAILGQIAMSDIYPQHVKNAVLEALMRKAESLTVIAILGELVEHGPDSTRMAALAHKLFSILEDNLLNEADYQEYEERRTILVTMCRIAARPHIGASAAETEAVRDSVVANCFRAIRDSSMIELAKPLARLAALPWTKAELAHEIRQRLRRFGLLPESPDAPPDTPVEPDTADSTPA